MPPSTLISRSNNNIGVNLSWKITWRYLFGKKSTNAIQLITGISVLGLGFGTAAIILILSVFNGFETLLLSMYDAFNPDIKITAAKGKSFAADEALLSDIRAIDGIDSISLSLEELALFQLNNHQEVGTIKGVDEGFGYVTGIDSSIRRNRDFIRLDKRQYGLFGIGMAYKLGLNPNDRISDIAVYIPNTKKRTPLDQQFSVSRLFSEGTFSIQHEVDQSYVLSSLDLVRRLTKKPNQISAVEVKIASAEQEAAVVEKLKQLLGADYVVKGRLEQEASTVKVMRIEKWLSFLILIFALILIAFNLIGAIWMIVLEKQKDLAVLSAMGARRNFVQQIIMKLGALICFIGIGFGFVFGLLFYFLHKRYGLIKMGEQAIVDAYPMELFWSDLPIVAAVVLLIGLVAVMFPTWKAMQAHRGLNLRAN